jgi:hypothetical protein
MPQTVKWRTQPIYCGFYVIDFMLDFSDVKYVYSGKGGGLRDIKLKPASAYRM